jgi:XTP/dITP diphosphohydrolase
MSSGLDKDTLEAAGYFVGGFFARLFGKRPPLVCVTANSRKLSEYRTLRGINGLLKSGHDFPDVADPSIEAVAERKLKVAQSNSQLKRVPFFVEVSGLEIHALSGLPGGLTKHFIDRVNASGICKMLSGFDEQGRAATAVAALYFSYRGEASQLICGRVNGHIALEPAGDSGFDWDTIFIPQGHSKTFAQLGQELKNQYSPRKVACDQLRVLLQQKGML